MLVGLKIQFIFLSSFVIENEQSTSDFLADLSLKGFHKDGNLKNNTIESMYSLCDYYPEADAIFVGQASAVLMILVGLATRTKLLKNVHLKNIDDLAKSNELMFLGSLMMKLINIRRNNNDAVSIN